MILYRKIEPEYKYCVVVFLMMKKYILCNYGNKTFHIDYKINAHNFFKYIHKI